MLTEILNLLPEVGLANQFRPYSEINKESDSLTFYFRPDADYSKRLTDHVTLYLSLDSHEVVGCRIKGIKGIIEDLPNYVEVNHGNTKLRFIFWSFRGCATNDVERKALNDLAKGAGDLTLAG